LNSGCESASSTRAIAILSSEQALHERSGCLLSSIRRPDAYYSRRNLPYESRCCFATLGIVRLVDDLVVGVRFGDATLWLVEDGAPSDTDTVLAWIESFLE
jgi:hypothetical protein